MSLYAYLAANMITEGDSRVMRACGDIERAFKRYMKEASPQSEEMLVSAIEPWLLDSRWTLKDRIDRDIVKKSPKGRMVMTQALLYCLDQYGLEEAQKARRQDLFNIPLILHLAKQNDCYLIFEMNALRAGREDKEERNKVKFQCTLYAEHDRLGEELTEFFYRLKHPVEDEARMQGSLDKILNDIMLTKQKTEAQAAEWLRELMIGRLGADQWIFLSLVYDRYSCEQEVKYTTATKSSLSDADRAELKKVEDTHNAMNTLTKLQAAGMLMGGFTFGIEAGMLLLEEAAEEEWLKSWHILLLSAALCMTLGKRLGSFFFRSHIYELNKQNKENYFNAKQGDPNDKDDHPISWTAVVGTGAEGLLVLFGLVTSGFFASDMVTMTIKNALGSNDKYGTDIFGSYFWSTMTAEFGGWGYAIASAVSLVIGVAAVGSAASLTCGHYALDGQETKEYEAKQRKLIAMKRVA